MISLLFGGVKKEILFLMMVHPFNNSINLSYIQMMVYPFISLINLSIQKLIFKLFQIMNPILIKNIDNNCCRKFLNLNFEIYKSYRKNDLSNPNRKFFLLQIQFFVQKGCSKFRLYIFNFPLLN